MGRKACHKSLGLPKSNRAGETRQSFLVTFTKERPVKMSHSGFLSLLGLTGNRSQKSEGKAIAGGLRDLVMEQHRTLFYTVTISTPPSAAASPAPPAAERHLLIAPALKEKTLKWQCATSLQVAVSDKQDKQQLQPLLHSCLSRRWRGVSARGGLFSCENLHPELSVFPSFLYLPSKVINSTD